jgi:hypothetical protein
MSNGQTAANDGTGLMEIFIKTGQEHLFWFSELQMV